MFRYICFVFVAGLACVHCALCPERSVEVKIPNSVKVGDSADLVCNFIARNEEDHLINVRWYKENEEFYRFTPVDHPPIKVFSLPGITVDEQKSTAKTVVLKNVQDQLTANYTCEVSWTVPNTAIVRSSKRMFVVEELQGDLILTVDNEAPGLGDNLQGVCITPPSKVVPTFTWYLNGEKVYNWFSPATRKNSNVPKRFTSFFNERVQFVNNQANLTCVVQIDNVYETHKSVILKKSNNQGVSYAQREYAMSGSSTATINMGIFAAVLVGKFWSLF
ncbi:uncharacterized protein LOC126890394 [Diabrotica virgifera virgifera]|uniref:Ig-like domain-containing protein n=1 Tax=Diabrotica virgifera virgifera TaxID=50390 RepID=A0ABM5KYI8_DIAVI|nr:uncharacterized protein LOC126890394 [Diabrotica virgifera virgifera]